MYLLVLLHSLAWLFCCKNNIPFRCKYLLLVCVKCSLYCIGTILEDPPVATTPLLPSFRIAGHEEDSWLRTDKQRVSYSYTCTLKRPPFTGPRLLRLASRYWYPSDRFFPTFRLANFPFFCQASAINVTPCLNPGPDPLHPLFFAGSGRKLSFDLKFEVPGLMEIWSRRTYVYVKSPLRRLLGAGGKVQPASVLFCLSRVLSSEENRLGTWLDLTVINVTALPLICITVMLVGLL